MGNERAVVTFDVSLDTDARPEVVYDVLADLSTHIDWAGTQSSSDSFKLLTLDAPEGHASVGTRFSSTGANSKDGSSTFHDSSIVTEARAPNRFAFDTDAQLHRKRRPTWEVRFVHTYDVRPDGDGSRIHYTCGVYPQNYRPYWLHPLARPALKMSVQRLMTKHMQNLSRMAEERSSGTAPSGLPDPDTQAKD